MTLYRAKFRNDKNYKWHYGYFFNNCDFGVNQSYIVESNDNTGTGDHFIVDTSTLGQFTGLQDKTNNNIFQGDYFIYKKHPKYSMDSFIGQVVWIEEYACFGYIKLKGSYNFIPTPFTEHDELKNDVLNFLEVVGNIIDNKIDELVAQHSI